MELGNEVQKTADLLSSSSYSLRRPPDYHSAYTTCWMQGDAHKTRTTPHQCQFLLAVIRKVSVQNSARAQSMLTEEALFSSVPSGRCRDTYAPDRSLSHRMQFIIHQFRHSTLHK